jgi:hypothetical protein
VFWVWESHLSKKEIEMKKVQIVVYTLLVYFVFTVSIHAQAATATCPDGMVCITREAAQKALEAGDRAKALEAEIKVKDQAISDLKDELSKVRVSFAEASGENTILKQQQVRDSAMIELLSKMVRPKKFGVINF